MEDPFDLAEVAIVAAARRAAGDSLTLRAELTPILIAFEALTSEYSYGWERATVLLRQAATGSVAGESI